jgi:imidazolonepropionase
MSTQKLIGPFKQIVSMRKLPLKGPLSDTQLEIIPEGGILVERDKILHIGDFQILFRQWKDDEKLVDEIKGPQVLIPGFVDPHTHICWAGSRVSDFALRLEGRSYEEIAKAGGGIWSTVLQTRKASAGQLERNIRSRASALMINGTTTIEVKSGYGLTAESELKILEAIRTANEHVVPDLIPTCLAAHMLPADFQGNAGEYLEEIIRDLLPEVMKKKLSRRADIYIEKGAFSPAQAGNYLKKAKELGFDVTVHADQFSAGGSDVAVRTGALSADHLEASREEDIPGFVRSATIPVALPGASLGLGEPFAPARKLLDAGASLAMGSDWNPGTAPMGDLLVQASVLGVYEKLSIAEILAAITFRSAAALDLHDRGILDTGKVADLSAFPVHDYREIIYNQGRIKPSGVWKGGQPAYKHF